MNDGYKKFLLAVAFLIWSTIILSALYIAQRPLFPQVIGGMFLTFWAITLLVLLLVNAAGIGYFILEHLSTETAAHERLLLGTGLGLGVLGLAGYGLAAFGLAGMPTLLFVLFSILLWVTWTGSAKKIQGDLSSFIQSFLSARVEAPTCLPAIILLVLWLGFSFTFLPPAEGFDGLFYHLTLPERLLADKQVLPYIIPQFWFPSLIEGNFIWAVGLGSERTAQMIHWSFSMLTLALIWDWSRTQLGNKSAWWTLAVLASMPSLPRLSAWAYNDFALVFYGLAALYAVWKSDGKSNGWLWAGGMFAGMAMGIKYTSFSLPIFCIMLIFLFGKDFRTRVAAILRFSLAAAAIASPWYIRNWLIMGNLFYPFVFGGHGWDDFLAQWYSGSGTGIGWDVVELVLLPFNTMLGHRDQNYYDGRIGPFFLLFLPFALWALWEKRRAPQHGMLFILSAFAAVNAALWTFGVIQTNHLWQARLLLPGLVPLAVPIGLGIMLLPRLDLPRLRVSFISTAFLGLVIALTLLDNSLSLVARRPLQYALGMESRHAYFERWQPRYASALTLVASTPPDAFVYFIYEPRSYNMPRRVQPDSINSNFAHDIHLFGSASDIIQDWKSKGYTHILVYNQLVEQDFPGMWNETLPYLQRTGEDGEFSIYSISP